MSFCWGTAVASPEPASLEVLLQEAHQKKLAQDATWQHLLHVRATLWGIVRSEVDDPRFFLSPQGAQDAAAELDATLGAFFAPAPPVGEDAQAHAQCRFPARLAWLKRHLSIDEQRLPAVSCARFDAWRTQMNAYSATLVFASAYLNNPASMYGHTFFLLTRPPTDPTAANALLDYAVNFAADSNTSNGVLFAMKGLTGGFRGRFSSLPYYVKIQEYTNLESRDLWEYPLRLSPDQAAFLTAHLWELGQASAAYFFFNKNCSYQLLPALDVLNPEWDLAKPFIWKAIPSDTLRAAVTKVGVPSAPSYRPSFRAEMLARRSRLTKEEIHLAEALADVQQKGKPFLPEGRQALVLESAHDLLRYRYGFKRHLPDAMKEREQQVLSWRSQFKEQAFATPAVSKPIPPERGHRSGRIGIAHGFSHRSSFEELSLRAAMHDLIDPVEGYPEGSQLEMFSGRLRWDHRQEVPYVEEATLANVISLPAWDRWVRKPAWKVNTGLRTAHDIGHDPDHALYYGLNMGSGLAYALPRRTSRLYALAEWDSGVGKCFHHMGRIGGGGVVGGIFDLWPSFRVQADARYWHYAWGPSPSLSAFSVTPSWSFHSGFDLRVQWKRENAYQELLLSVLSYL